MKVNLVWITPKAEDLIAYIARVSNPSNQDNPEYTKLIRYLINNRHWSPFEMASMCVEIETSRAISAQILRHRSFSFQEFSQRYAEVQEIEPIELRRQSEKNRQSSTEKFDPYLYVYEDSAGGELASEEIAFIVDEAQRTYERLIKAGVAKETARMILPMASKTRLYMSGTLRSWIHYLEIRDNEHAQLEHQLIAREIKKIFIEQLPIVSEALEWK
jgi:thymidylate synthase (FAD)